jgi:hypothetical protein
MKIASPLLFLTCTVALACASLLAQNSLKPTVWIDPANPYANYLEAAVLKKHTPVTFTMKKDSAQYIASLTEESKKGSVAKAIFLGAAAGQGQNNMSLSVADAKTGNVLFSYTCQKGRQKNYQSTAECLAKHWTHFIEKGKP